ncbi:hypothetical protein GE061_020158 [Apolygus lucorum]|uniref:Uncharacterized protein n=1 Tax=Apolygus lucorum TaxID=248454 RepID=A0A8S9WPW9_APOLU|nr:hypothetical protein GE061_020158 [Apolygus lucorum]
MSGKLIGTLNDVKLSAECARRAMKDIALNVSYRIHSFRFYKHEIYGMSVLLTAFDEWENEPFSVFLPKRYANELKEQDFSDFDKEATPLYFSVVKRTALTSYLKFSNDVASY